MPMSTLYVRAHWLLYDMVFYEIPRGVTFKRLLKLGLSAREAALMIQDCEKEPN